MTWTAYPSSSFQTYDVTVLPTAKLMPRGWQDVRTRVVIQGRDWWFRLLVEHVGEWADLSFEGRRWRRHQGLQIVQRSGLDSE